MSDRPPRGRQYGSARRSHPRYNGPNQQPGMFPFRPEMMPNNLNNHPFPMSSFQNGNRYPRPSQPNIFVEEQNGFDFDGEDCFMDPFLSVSNHNSKNMANKKKKRKTIPYTLVRPTFDPYLTPEFFPPVNDKAEDDEEIVQAFNRKLSEIIPKPEDLSSLSNFVSKMSTVLEKFKVSGPADCKIECIELVGSYRMNTLVNKNCCADMVVTLKTVPIKTTISNMGNRITEELQELDSLTPFHVNYFEEDGILEFIRICSQDKVHLHFTTTRENFGRIDEETHLKRSVIFRSIEAIRHTKWFGEFVPPDSDVHNLIRIMKEVRARFKDFQHLNPWMIITMCHYAMTYTVDQSELPIWIAFRRIFQLFSAGSFLPYSSGITDPMGSKMPIHGRLAVQNQEEVTNCAQTLLRVMNYKHGINYIFGYLPAPEISVLDMPSQWQGVTVVPGTSVFTGKPQKKIEAN